MVAIITDNLSSLIDGRLTWKEIVPNDPVGIVYGRVFLTPDGQHYLYQYRRIDNRLFLPTGL